MKTKIKTVKHVESKFNEDEIFFSTTDKKGIILSGNSVFYKVAKYSPEELIGKPHNIVRHPDMPKTVFKLLWNYIQSKKPIVAYVKNLAKDGSYYWVLALVLPVVDEKGEILKYLSMRIKPTTDFINIIPEIYKEMLKIEKEKGIEEAEELLFNRLYQLGFKSYDDFMFKALRKEIISKKNILSKKEGKFFLKTDFERKIYRMIKSANQISYMYDSILLKTDKLENLGKILNEKSEFIFEITDRIRLISLNSSVESFKLGSKGASFSVLSAEMRKNSELGNRIIKNMKKDIESLIENLYSLTTSISISKLAILTVIQFLQEVVLYGADKSTKQNIEDLLHLLNSGIRKDFVLFISLKEALENISKDVRELKILLKRLEFLYLNGMIESAYQTENSFSIIFSEVNNLVETVRNVILDINEPLLEVIDENRKNQVRMLSISSHVDTINKTSENLKDILV